MKGKERRVVFTVVGENFCIFSIFVKGKEVRSYNDEAKATVRFVSLLTPVQNLPLVSLL